MIQVRKSFLQNQKIKKPILVAGECDHTLRDNPRLADFFQHLLFLLFFILAFLTAGTMDWQDAVRAENAGKVNSFNLGDYGHGNKKD